MAQVLLFVPEDVSGLNLEESQRLLREMRVNIEKLYRAEMQLQDTPLTRKEPKTTRGYTELCQCLERAGIPFRSSGSAKQDKDDQVEINIPDEQDSGYGISITFDVDGDGNETFVCCE